MLKQAYATLGSTLIFSMLDNADLYKPIEKKKEKTSNIIEHIR